MNKCVLPTFYTVALCSLQPALTCPPPARPPPRPLAGLPQASASQQGQQVLLELHTRTRAKASSRDAAIASKRSRQMSVEAARQTGRAARVQLFRSYRIGGWGGAGRGACGCSGDRHAWRRCSDHHEMPGWVIAKR